MTIIINNENITDDSIREEKAKVRALIVTPDNKVLMARYGETLLLPGGTIDLDEEPMTAMIRELQEEIGIEYYNEELKEYLTIKYYQKDFPKRNGMIANRIITTYIFLAKYKGFCLDNQKLTDKEKGDNFNISLYDMKDLKNILSSYSLEKSRRSYFAKELEILLSKYEETTMQEKIKQKSLEKLS